MQPPGFEPPVVVHDREIVPVESFVIVKKVPERDWDTTVKVLLVPRAATEPELGGMLLSIGRLVLTIVAFDVQDEYAW